MLTLLSPAKKLLQWTAPFAENTSAPLFRDKTAELVRIMQSKSISEIASLMSLSQNLAELNYHRYHNFCSDDSDSSKFYPALYLFQGDVYQGLQAATWDKKAVAFAQSHCAILSGLYGILKPLDAIQPYRLEMGTALANSRGAHLYDFWKETVTSTINQQLATQKNPLLINLASSEYFKVVDSKKLNYPILTINFYEDKNNQMKMIGIHAKKARGTMAKFIMCHQIDTVDKLKEFNELGYRFNPENSSATHLDFARKA